MNAAFHTIPHTDKVFAQAIHTLFQRAYKLEADLLGARDFPPLRRTLEDIMESSCSFHGFINDNRLSALIEIEEQHSQLCIHSLVVDPDFFRTGFASRLLRLIIISSPCKPIQVSTAQANLPAMTLYKKMGFHPERFWQTPDGMHLVDLVYPNKDEIVGQGDLSW